MEDVMDMNVFRDAFPTDSCEVLSSLSRTISPSLCFGSISSDEGDHAIELRGISMDDTDYRENHHCEWSVSVWYMLFDDHYDGECLGEQYEASKDGLPYLLNMVRLNSMLPHTGSPCNAFGQPGSARAQFPNLRTLRIGSDELVENITLALTEDPAGLLLPKLRQLSICMGNAGRNTRSSRRIFSSGYCVGVRPGSCTP